jgi:hypothetical protein
MTTQGKDKSTLKTFLIIFAAVVAALLLVLLIAGASCASCVGSSILQMNAPPSSGRH